MLCVETSVVLFIIFAVYIFLSGFLGVALLIRHRANRYFGVEGKLVTILRLMVCLCLWRYFFKF